MELGRTKNRVLVAAGMVAGFLLIGWMIFRESPISVETGTVARGEMLVTVDGEGKTRFRDKVTVGAPHAGLTTGIRLREGDPIPKEYVITGIDPNPPIPPRPPNETEGRLNPYASKVYAPISGRILRVFERDARIVQAGAPLIEIGNPSAVEVVVDVLSTDAAQVHPGASVLIDSESTGEPIRGRVRSVEPQAFTKISALGVEEQRVNIVIDFLNKDVSFGDNFRVDVRIIVWRGENVLKIPSSALFRSGDRWSVFVADRGRARRHDVTVGHLAPAESEILVGLTEGESVVLHPPNSLTDGGKIALQ